MEIRAGCRMLIVGRGMHRLIGSSMSKKPRDFYHIQDRLCLGWRYTSGIFALSSQGIAALTKRIDLLSDKNELNTSSSAELIDLMAQKIALLYSNLCPELLQTGPR